MSADIIVRFGKFYGRLVGLIGIMLNAVQFLVLTIFLYLFLYIVYRLLWIEPTGSVTYWLVMYHGDLSIQVHGEYHNYGYKERRNKVRLPYSFLLILTFILYTLSCSSAKTVALRHPTMISILATFKQCTH